MEYLKSNFLALFLAFAAVFGIGYAIGNGKGKKAKDTPIVATAGDSPSVPGPGSSEKTGKDKTPAEKPEQVSTHKI